MSTTRTRPPAGPERKHLDEPGSRRGTTSLLQSFNYAFEGIVWVLKTQRNMRIHFLLAAGVLIGAFAYDVSKLELIALVLAIAFVLVTEMFNTAIEAVTDLATSSFHPLAKLAKDISAGAVLDRIGDGGRRRLPRSLRPPRPPARRHSRQPASGASPSHRDRAHRRAPRRHRREGRHRPGNPAAGRIPVRPRGARLRLLDGDHVRDRGLHSSSPRLDRRLPARGARRADPRRGGHPLAARGRGRRGCSARR